MCPPAYLLSPEADPPIPSLALKEITWVGNVMLWTNKYEQLGRLAERQHTGEKTVQVKGTKYGGGGGGRWGGGDEDNGDDDESEWKVS